jgi:SAM-dependent methyltransferase
MSPPASELTPEALHRYLAVWKTKPVLRAVYGDFYDRIAAACGPGPTLEIGAGIGNLPGKLPDVIGSDIQFGPWLNLVADAQRMPFGPNTLGNIVMVDVLHHIEHTLNFFREAARVLKQGGPS